MKIIGKISKNNKGYSTKNYFKVKKQKKQKK